MLTDGSCVTHAEPDLWTSGAYADEQRAKKVCAGCPALAECEAFADVRYGGVYAGLTQGERLYRQTKLRGIVQRTRTDASRARDAMLTRERRAAKRAA